MFGDYITLNNYCYISGTKLKQLYVSHFSEYEVQKEILKNPFKYKIGEIYGSSIFNTSKARSEALNKHEKNLSSRDPCVQEVLKKWSDLTGLPYTEATFWKEKGFSDAIKKGRDIQLRRYIHSDGWAWLSIEDSPHSWTHKMRLPEKVRVIMLGNKKPL